MPVTELQGCIRRALSRKSAVNVAILPALLASVHIAYADTEQVSKHPLDTVVVIAQRNADYKQNASSVAKLTEVIRDTPQSITAVTSQEMDDRAVGTMSDALRTVPGISLGAGETSFQGTNLFLRGFTTRNDMFMDGMRDYGYYYRDPFNDSSIEVLKGPASTVFGRGSTGGVIEQVSKTATLDPHSSGSIQLGTDNTWRGTLDVDRPLSELGVPDLDNHAAIRLNAMIHQADVADRDVTQNKRWGVAPSLALGLGTPTRLNVSYFHQSDDITPDYGLPWFAGRPAPVQRSNFYGFDSDYLNTRVDIGTARLEHDVGATMTISNQTRYSRASREFRYSEAVIPTGTPATTPIEAITINRNEFQGYSTDSLVQNQTNLIARLTTGVIQHALATGIELGRETPNPVYITNVGLPTTNLAYPQPQTYSVQQSYPRLAAHTRATTIGLYVLDTIKFGDHWQTVLGARWDHFAAEYHSTSYSPTGAVTATTSLDHTDDAPSYRGAVVFKPVTAGTIYLSYGNSFNPSADGIESLISSGRALTQSNLNVDPEKSHTYELGTKWELLDSRVGLSAAVFRTEKTNARIPDPTRPGFNTLGGDQRVAGFEVEFAGRLNSVWAVRGGYTYLDSETVNSGPGGPLVGAPLTITPRNSASVWNKFKLPLDMEFAVGLLSVSSRLGQNTAASYLVAPGYTTLDLMAKRQLASHLSLQLNVSNLANKYYFDQLHPFHVVPGAGRTALLSMQLQY
jgi:catecholate siderophore receptor